MALWAPTSSLVAVERGQPQKISLFVLITASSIGSAAREMVFSDAQYGMRDATMSVADRSWNRSGGPSAFAKYPTRDGMLEVCSRPFGAFARDRMRAWPQTRLV